VSLAGKRGRLTRPNVQVAFEKCGFAAVR
jgi:hypothetical protein